MNSVDYLSSLAERGIQLWAEDGQLRFRAAAGTLTKEIRAELAGHKEELLAFLGGIARSEVSPIRPVPRDQPLPLSFVQERLWFVEQLGARTGAYNIPCATRVRGRLDCVVLERSINEVIRRHEILRTTFRLHNEKPVQIVQPFQHHRIEFVNLESPATQDIEREINSQLCDVALQPFDLEQGPLLRVRVIRVAEDDFVILYALHHIISDAWSAAILNREVALLYGAFARELASPLSGLALQYGDFAAWQRSQSEDRVGLDYWKSQLANCPILELPLDFVRPPQQTFRGETERDHIENPLAASLYTLARQERATLFSILLAGFTALLHRHTGQTDIICGTPIASRPQEELEQLIGPFVNTVVFRNRLDEQVSFRKLLRQVQETVLKGMAHQNIPFERLVEELRLERDLSRHPITQVIFALQNVPEAGASVAELQWAAIQNDSKATRADLEVNISEVETGLAVTFMYNPDLFRAATIQRLVRHYRSILAAAVAEPDRAIAELPLMLPEEREQLIRWNDTSHPECECAFVHEAIADWGRERPDMVAVVSPEGRLTYGELNRRANQVARRLTEFGVGPEVPVAVFLERSINFVVGVLGILKAGGAYVPVDGNYPAERVNYVLADAGISIVVTTRDQQDALPTSIPMVVCVEECVEVDADEVEQALHDENLAYVIYTSGSTGKPKGVQLQHSGLWNLVTGQIEEFQITVGTRVLQFASVGFDASVSEIFTALVAGGELHLLSPDRLLPGGGLEQELKDRYIEVVTLPPSVLAMISTAGMEALRTVVSAGEACPAAVAHRWSSGRRFINAYGPTEATVCATMNVCDESEASPTIGRPMRNVRVYILDGNMELVPVGVPGELYIGGAGVGRGYIGGGDLTADRFFPDPFSGGEGGRLYRTGDLARRREDGVIEWLARLDQQVKLRGFRIELGEIESVLRREAGVEAVVVAMREEVAGDRRLVAYVLPSREGGQVVEREGQVVEEWRRVFEGSYTVSTDLRDPTFNISSWVSSYGGRPFPEEEMREWVEGIIGRMGAPAPRRVLDVGCGTGLLLFRLAPHCDYYAGLDISEQAVTTLRGQTGSWPQVKVSLLPAHELAAFAGEAFDLVILNSVVQYFPGEDYLLRVLDTALNLLAEGGRIVIGDVRHFGLLEAFAASVEVGAARTDLTAAEFKQAVQSRMRADRELLLDPRWFAGLRRLFPKLRSIRVMPKRGRFHNELTCFRYDVVLQTGSGAGNPEEGITWEEWNEATTSPAALAVRLQKPGGSFGLRRVPNPRLHLSHQVLAWCERVAGTTPLAEFWEALSPKAPGAHPEDFWALANAEYEVEVSWLPGDASGDFAVSFLARTARQKEELPESGEPVAEPEPERQWASNPLSHGVGQDLVERLTRLARAQLPEYMVPAQFVVLSSLPLSPNGKIDRKRLPAPEQAQRSATATFVAPRTAFEKELAEMWKNLLHTHTVGIHDNFFELGGHSLLATQLVTRIKEVLNRDVPLKAVFQYPTLSALAAHTEIAGPVEPNTLRIPVARRDGVLPLSFAQERLWFLHQLSPEDTAYNITSTVNLHGRLSVAALEFSFRELCQRHEILRTTFAVKDGKPEQVIHADGFQHLEVVDLSWLPPAEMRAAMKSWVMREKHQCFDLERGPLLRLRLFQLSPEHHVLVYSMHHIIADAWSRAIIHRELSALYQSHINHGAVSLPNLPVNYADFAVWQRQRLTPDALEDQLAFWKRELRDAIVPVELPTDRPRPKVQSYQGAMHRMVLGRQTTAAVKQLAKTTASTLYMVMLTALEIVLYRYTGREVFIGTPVANRQLPEIEPLIGFFANTLVMRLKLSDNPSTRTLLLRARETALGAYACQDVPFEQVVEAVLPNRDPGYHPLFQVMLIVQNSPFENLVLPGVNLRPFNLLDEEIGSEHNTSRFDLSWQVQEAGEELDLVCEYSTDLFDPATVHAMGDHLRSILDEMSARPDCTVSELAIWSEREQKEIQVPPQTPGMICWHEVFHQRVAENESRTAIIEGARSWTFGELSRSSRHLAGRLRAVGVREGSVVMIMTSRTAVAVSSILGVLNTGGAFVLPEPGTEGCVIANLQGRGLAAIITDDSTASPSGFSVPVVFWEAEVTDNQCADASLNIGTATTACLLPQLACAAQVRFVTLSHEVAMRILRPHGVWPQGAADCWAVVSSSGTESWLLEVWPALLSGATVCDCAASLDRHRLSSRITAICLNQEGVRRLPELCRDYNKLQAVLLWNCSMPGTNAFNDCFHRLNAFFVEVHFAEGGFAVWSESPLRLPEGRVRLARESIRSSLAVFRTTGEQVPNLGWGELFVGSLAVANAPLSDSAGANESAEGLRSSGVRARILTSGNIELDVSDSRRAMIGGSSVDLDLLGGIIASLATAKDGYLVCRQSSDGASELVMFLVGALGFDEDTTKSILRENLPARLMPACFISVTDLPLLPSGIIDECALGQFEVIEPVLVNRWQEVLTSNEKIKTAAVIVEGIARPKSSVHLEDLFADYRTAWLDNVNATNGHDNAGALTGETAPLQLAVADGGPLEIPRTQPGL